MTDLFRNPDGKTFNGVKLMAWLSGLSESEIRWTADRLRYLIHVEHKSKDEAKRIVKDEAKIKPWEKL